MRSYNYSYEDNYYPGQSNYYDYEDNSHYRNNGYFQDNNPHSSQNNNNNNHHHQDYDYNYQKEDEDHKYKAYPYNNNSFHNYYPQTFSSHSPRIKINQGAHQENSNIQNFKYPVGSHFGNYNGKYTYNSPEKLKLSAKKIISNKKSLKPTQILQQNTDNTCNYTRPHPSMYSGPQYIPLIEENEYEVYKELYNLDETANRICANMQESNNSHSLKADSPSNYKPFGTHFGPRVLTRNAGQSDFLTPQSKHLSNRQYNNLPGDCSSKMTSLKKNENLTFKTQPELLGFSSLVEKVLNQDNQDQQSM